MFTRYSSQTYMDEEGEWHLNQSINVPSYSKLGILIEPKRTNFLAVNTDAFADSLAGMHPSENVQLSVVNDLDALNQSGLKNITLGKAFEVINSSNQPGSLIFDRANSTTGRLALSVFAATEQSDIKIYVSGRAGLVDVPISQSAKPYCRVISENIHSVTGSETLEMEIPAGAKMRFILPQLEQAVGVKTAGVTSPIINHGTPNTREFTKLVIKNNTWAAGKFALGMDVTPTSSFQDESAGFYFDLYKNATNRLRFLGAAGLNVISPTVNSYVFGKYAPQLDTTSHLLVYSGEQELAVVDGALPNTMVAAPQDIDLSHADLYLGSKQDSSQVFTGWIKNIKFYSGSMDNDQLRELTKPSIVPEPIGVTGIPLYDTTNAAKIYVLGSRTSLGFGKILVSENNGETLSELYKLCEPTRYNALQRDINGNFYYSSNSNLMRVENSTGACTSVLNWSAFLPATETYSWSWNSWHWAISNEGWLYATAYTTSGLGGQMIYVSKDHGKTWSNIPALIEQFPLDRHIHSLLVNPADNKLYVSIGDDANQRGNFVSAEPVNTWNQQDFTRLNHTNYAKGATGLTFTDEWVYWSSDTVGDSNFIVRTSSDPASEQPVIEMPGNFNITPVYFLLSQGNNRLISVSYNEKATTAASGALMIWQKPASKESQWKIKKIYAQYDFNSAEYGFYALGHNGHGTIPTEAGYIYVTTLRTDNKLPGMTYRVKIE